MLKNDQRFKQILVVFATVGLIFVNFLAGAGKINDTAPGAVSDRYPTLLTPAGYAFSIWSLIYLGLAAFSVYQALPAQAANPLYARVRTLYIANCAANCGWIYLWHYGYIAASILAMFFILATLILINSNLRNVESAAEIWTTRVPFNIYFGWVTVAAILNAAITLVYLGVELPLIATAITAVLLIAVAVVLAITIRRNFDFPSYALTVAWALVAIAVNQSAETIIMTAALIGAAIAVLTAFFGRKRT